ncbi:MAG: phage major capsid protein [Clostridia bacterium]|nr:phage major capsid protein [Clostridia bacterium]
MNYIATKYYIAQPEYAVDFWSAMRRSDTVSNTLEKGRNTDVGAYALPERSMNKYDLALSKESQFRSICTVMKAYDAPYKIQARTADDLAVWVAEGEAIPIKNAMDDFTTHDLRAWKLASLFTLENSFVADAAFDVENYITGRLAKNFSRAEENTFLNGTGVNQPAGLFHDTLGAETAFESASLTYDDVIRLYFSVKPEYRKNAVWMMNDETAMMLRTLKDNAGNYLWRDSDDTIFGKNVVISEFMPNIGAGAKPVLFGDFRYYWIVDRSPVTVRTLHEHFALYDQIGYLAYEFLDGKLIRKDAVKTIKIMA